MVETTKPLAAGPAQNSEAMPALWWLWLPLGGALVLLACAQLYPAAYEAWVAGERGALEFLHVVIPLASLALALRMLTMPEVRRRWPLWLWLALAALGSLYVAGEEASWGQHYFGWATPETWQAVNDQGETNLHNTSSWLDQKPRSLLELGVVLGGILTPLMALRWPGMRRARLAIILPPMICLPSALIAEFARMSERVLGALADGVQLFNRASEVQELYFYLFILLYLIVLYRRLPLLRSPAAVQAPE